MTRSASFFRLLACALLAALAPACGDDDGPADPGDSGLRDSGGGGGDSTVEPPRDAGGGPLDGTVAPDAGPGPTDDGGPAACSPSGGTELRAAYCDLFELALVAPSTGAPREARLFGRLSPDGLADGACAVVDEVEVQEAGRTIATLPGAGAFAAGDERAALAVGPATPEMEARCTDDMRRYGGFGLLVRGRVDGASFEAHCADAEGGGRWPPALRITCHAGVDRHPFTAYAQVTGGGPFPHTQIDIMVPHGAGGALSTVDARIHVIPGVYSFAFGPPPPMVSAFDSDGWGGSVSESTAPVTGTYSQVSLFHDGAELPESLCPPPMLGPPDPMAPPPPVFLVRISGSGERGPYSTEAYVQYCNTLSM